MTSLHLELCFDADSSPYSLEFPPLETLLSPSSYALYGSITICPFSSRAISATSVSKCFR